MNRKIDKKWIDTEMATDEELANEALLRQNADTSHQSQITANANAISAETSQRQAADTNLQNQINTNTSAIATKYDASNPSGFETPSQLNTRDTNNRNRSNHTGTQLASTISDFANTVRGVVLTGLSLVSSTAITATDSLIVALGKLQAQITKLIASSYQTWDVANHTSVVTSSSTTWVTHSTITQNLELSDYRLNFFYGIHIANNGRTADIRVIRNGTEVVFSRTRFGSNNTEIITGGNVHRFVGLSGNNTFELQFKVGSAGATSVTIDDTRMYLTRVGL